MSKPLTIAVFGTSLISAHHNVRVNYVRGVLRALAARGHRIAFYEPLAFDRQQHRDIPDPDWCESVAYHASLNSVRLVLDTAREADVVIKAGEAGVFDSFLDEEILAFQARGTTVVYWDLNPPTTLTSLERDPNDLFAALLPEYDHIVLPSMSEALADEYHHRGAERVLGLPSAVNPEETATVPPDDRFAADLLFVGDLNPGQNQRLRDWFFAAASQLPEIRFLIAGEGWNTALPDEPNLRSVGAVSAADWPALLCTPGAVLELRRVPPGELDLPGEDRYLAAGLGACLICDDRSALRDELLPHDACLSADSPDDLVAVLRAFDPDHARAVGRAAREYVLGHHTYAHRAAELEAVLRRS